MTVRIGLGVDTPPASPKFTATVSWDHIEEVRAGDLTPQQLFTWRREARKRLEAEASPAFVPAIVVAAGPAAAPAPESRPKRRAPRRSAAAIELEASGVTVRIGDGASPATIAAVIAALKGAP